MSYQPPLPRWKRPEGYTTVTDERKLLILDVLRKSLVPMTRREITAALGWSDKIIVDQTNTTMNPLVFLEEEGKVGKFRDGKSWRYFADPDLSEMLKRK